MPWPPAAGARSPACDLRSAEHQLIDPLRPRSLGCDCRRVGRPLSLPRHHVNHARERMALVNDPAELVGKRHHWPERDQIEHLEQRRGVLLDQVGTGAQQVRDRRQGGFVYQGVVAPALQQGCT